MPIEYQDLTFRFENEEERFVVTMSLGVQEFSLKAVRKKDASVLGVYAFKTVRHVEKRIGRDEKELLIQLDGVERFVITVITIEITFLPSFCIMVKEHFSGE